MMKHMRIWAVLASFLVFFYIPQSYAGVALGATRVIYPEGQKQVQLAVTNNDDKSSYLIQSWIENAEGKKDARFVITPPLFSMQGKKENTLRIIDATNGQMPEDRESLFWVNVKAIPAMDKAKTGENYLQFAIVSRIKLLYRPQGLVIPSEQAPGKLEFTRENGGLTLFNPTPYYLTVTDLKAGNKSLENTMVPPQGKVTVNIPGGYTGGDITYKTINDYGALTEQVKGVVK
ncbi:S/F1C fimbrial biogenesis chaperone SfaE/FocC [Escherichia coli]